jgi:hypothetical protein
MGLICGICQAEIEHGIQQKNNGINQERVLGVSKQPQYIVAGY